MLLTAQALKKGPANLTFAFQNCSAIFPGVILFLFFGTELGFSCTYIQGIGMCLVILGLFLGVNQKSGDNTMVSLSWLKYALGCLMMQVLALTFIQGRCVLFEGDKLNNYFSFLTLEREADVWFMPGFFGLAFFLQLLLFLKEKRGLRVDEIKYGLLGGVSNVASTFLLLFATKWALPYEKTILFPCFAVSTVILCNAWAAKLYKEKFNFLSNALCALGIFIGL